MDGTAGGLLAGLESLALRRRPGKSGSRDGWMLTIRPCQQVTKPALRTRRNPARASDRRDCQHDRAQRSGDRVERGFCNHLLGIGFDALIIKGEASNRLIGDLKMPVSTLPY
jgi:hypothetical protein